MRRFVVALLIVGFGPAIGPAIGPDGSLNPGSPAMVFALPGETHGAVRTFSVRDEPVEEVLLAFAEQTGVSIVTDSTVDGTVSLVLHETTPRQAVMQLVEAANLLAEERDGILWVSRVRVESAADDTVIVQAAEAPLHAVVGRISSATGRQISLRADGTVPVTTTLGPMPLEALLEALGEPLDLTSTGRDGGFVLAAGDVHHAGRPSDPPGLRLATTGERLNLSARMVTVREVLDRVFRDRRDTYIAVDSLGSSVGTLQITAADQDALLRRVLLTLDLHAVEDGDTWFIASADGVRRLESLRSRAIVKPRHLTVEYLQEAIAGIPHVEVEVRDLQHNLLVLQALPAALEKAVALVTLLDNDPGGDGTVVLPVRESAPEVVAEGLRIRFPHFTFRPDDRRGEIVALVPEGRVPAVLAVLSTLDRAPATHRYISRHTPPEELIAAVGENHGLQEIVPGADRQSVIVRGSEQRVNRALEVFALVDHPRKQLRFDLCIIQYQSSLSSHRGTRASFNRDGSTMGVFETTWDAVVQFDQLLSLQFDLLSALGYQAALAVSGELATNAARLVVDTSLRAREGDTALLENASTYRYRDYPEGENGSTALGVTREIDSGLTVELSGTTHRDRSTTVTVRVSLSRQGTDLAARGNPPPTSRRVVETTVRVTAGEPIVIGGLLHQERTEAARRLPLIGRIPLLGRIVGNESSGREDTELVLYLSVFPELAEHPRERVARQQDRLEHLLDVITSKDADHAE
jgi:type II secretory pathway component GspD/PulD (secretin)